ncbi:MAG: hypothetical protein GY822_19140 [Deltaproteobacteria bacterium]|nr:hypothetical protein [Deltaproteobacteria bacterium]
MSTSFTFSAGLASGFHHTPLLRVKGPDAVAFLHRLSTQKLQAEPSQARLLCVLDKKGRIQELGQAMATDDEVLFLGWPGVARSPQETLEPFHFAEELEMSQVFAEIGLVVGPSSLAPYEAATSGALHFFGAPTVIFDGESSPALWVFSEKIGQVNAYLASHDVDKGSATDWENLRIQTGWPAFGAEASPKSNPLELELHDALSWTKGCYVGQEVISRIDNYDKQARRLVGIQLEKTLAVSAEQDVEIYLDSSAVGKVTSLAPDAKYALAMLKVASEASDGCDVELRVGGVVVAKGQTKRRHFAQLPHDG